MLNGIDLLRVITLIYFNIEEEKYVPQKVHEVKAAFHMPLKQVEGIPIGSGGGQQLPVLPRDVYRMMCKAQVNEAHTKGV